MDSHAPESVKRIFLPRMYAGDWLGTMCLSTEPHCGTDLGMIRTRAEPLEGDDPLLGLPSVIRITGSQRSESPVASTHMVDNIVHLVLAKLPDAAFRHPRHLAVSEYSRQLLDAEGHSAASNAVSCGSIEHKMGIKGSATCVMNFDGAEGVLIGEPHQGLAAMFTIDEMTSASPSACKGWDWKWPIRVRWTSLLNVCRAAHRRAQQHETSRLIRFWFILMFAAWRWKPVSGTSPGGPLPSSSVSSWIASSITPMKR